MPASDAVARTLDVPGARLYYQRQGAGPLLLLIGSPMDSAGFVRLARVLAGWYTVVTYDPRGIGHSTREDTAQDITPEQQADDVHRLLSALGGGPAGVFGSSGGAVVGLALVTAHPAEVSTLVAHEPPVIGLLPDRDQVRARLQDVYDTYRAEGPDHAMPKFMAQAGLAEAPALGPNASRRGPIPERQATLRAAAEVFLAHLLRPTTNYRPDIEALQSAPTRIVVAVGATSQGQLAHRSALALADRLATPATEFPGDHAGFVIHPVKCARVLHQLLTDPT
jgi:pimeloyl-ACP methyl ester carboxylesterase